jgi:low affinity Fe/Cu permease
MAKRKSNKKANGKKKGFFEKFAEWATKATGSSVAFLLASGIVVVWALTGPIFNYSETWQLVINTGTTIITFLMVFLIQKTQNKDSKAIHLKLNELIAANPGCSNRMVDIEDMTEAELDQFQKFYRKLVELAKRDDDVHTSHSIDAAEKSSINKSKHRKQSQL